MEMPIGEPVNSVLWQQFSSCKDRCKMQFYGSVYSWRIHFRGVMLPLPSLTKDLNMFCVVISFLIFRSVSVRIAEFLCKTGHYIFLQQLCEETAELKFRE